MINCFNAYRKNWIGYGVVLTAVVKGKVRFRVVMLAAAIMLMHKMAVLPLVPLHLAGEGPRNVIDMRVDMVQPPPGNPGI